MDPEHLYGLALERFTEERNALAKELRKGGRRELAGEVSKLRKPSVAAWAVNQLVRTQRREIADLFLAGDGLQKAQAQLLAGRSQPGALRAAVDAERAAVEHLTEKARGLLSSEGHELTPATLERVADTLHAAALEADARTQVQEGCLARELQHVGLGGLAADGARSQPRRSARKPDGARSQARKNARKAEADARRRADRAARGLKAAQDRRDRAAEALHDADAQLATARAQAEEAVRELGELQRSLDG